MVGAVWGVTLEVRKPSATKITTFLWSAWAGREAARQRSRAKAKRWKVMVLEALEKQVEAYALFATDKG
jgi:hypothetical protein